MRARDAQPLGSTASLVPPQSAATLTTLLDVEDMFVQLIECLVRERWWIHGLFSSLALVSACFRAAIASPVVALLKANWADTVEIERKWWERQHSWEEAQIWERQLELERLRGGTPWWSHC